MTDILIPDDVLLDTDLSDAAMRVYCVLLWEADGRSTCTVSQDHLARQTGERSDRSVRRAISELIVHGYVRKEAHSTYWVWKPEAA